MTRQQARVAFRPPEGHVSVASIVGRSRCQRPAFVGTAGECLALSGSLRPGAKGNGKKSTRARGTSRLEARLAIEQAIDKSGKRLASWKDCFLFLRQISWRIAEKKCNRRFISRSQPGKQPNDALTLDALSECETPCDAKLRRAMPYAGPDDRGLRNSVPAGIGMVGRIRGRSYFSRWRWRENAFF